MSLYRQASGFSSRALGGAVLATALLAILVGFLLGRGSVEDPSPAEVVAEARAELRPVELGLEQVPIEYESALGPDGEVAAQTEYEAAQATAARTEASLAQAGDDMRAIDPAGYAEAASAIEDLGSAIDSTASQARVEALAARAEATVEKLSG